MALPNLWNQSGPFGRLERLFDVDDMMRGVGLRSPLAREYERTLDMRIDVNEEDERFVVNVDMPGVRKEDIDVSIEGNQVSVRAEVRREESRGKPGKEIYNERFRGEAFRSFSLPTEIDSAGAKAAYDGGVLTLELPKKTGGASKRVQVS